MVQHYLFHSQSSCHLEYGFILVAQDVILMPLVHAAPRPERMSPKMAKIRANYNVEDVWNLYKVGVEDNVVFICPDLNIFFLPTHPNLAS